MNAWQRLWAPWRAPYITHTSRQPKGCIFCRAKRARDDRAVHVVARGRRVFCLLNLYPYNNGHLMVSPYRHIGSLHRLTAPEMQEMLGMAARMTAALTYLFHPDGFNLGINVGRIAGAGIPGHMHLHVVPRWQADTNFMSVVSNTKVISQSLEALYDGLTATLKTAR